MHAYINIDVDIRGKQYEQTKRFTVYATEVEEMRAILERETKELIDNIFRENDGSRKEK